MLKQKIREGLEKTIKDLGYPTTDIVVSISPNPDFGDYSSNVALQLAKQKGTSGNQSSLEIAKEILSHLGSLSNLEKVETAGNGFLNFFVKPEVLAEDLAEVLEKGAEFGRNNLGEGEKVQVEFISANPTGPLTLANGRGGALGDTLANVLIHSGYEVEREFYLNDTGNQVRLLGASIKAALGLIPAAENHYQGEYVKELANKLESEGASLARGRLARLDELEIGHLAADHLVESEIKPATLRLGVRFDQFYSERTLQQGDKLEKTLKLLKEKDLVYEKEGAVWFKSTQFGDEKDRVLITSTDKRGSQDPTYLLADLAHHLDIYSRGFTKRINHLGADHHSNALVMQRALSALGYEGRLDIVLFQLVRLFKGGVEVKMSKRAGNFVTLDELLEEVKVDVARFFFLMYAPSSHINFNLDLARERSDKNPVYFVQYAHARMSGILEKSNVIPAEAGIQEDGSRVKPGMTDIKFGMTLLVHPTEQALIKQLMEFPGLVEGISKSYQVHHLTAYSITLADLFHRFYESCRVLDDPNPDLVSARVSLVKATKTVLASALELMGISHPEEM